MKTLVVGGTGFVGMNVVRALVRGGHQVRATRRQRGNTLFARRLGAELVRAELDDLSSLVSAMRGCDVVFHAAGHYPRYSLHRSAEVSTARARTRSVLEAARQAGVRRVVVTSSVATIGPPRPGRLLSDERDLVERRSLTSVYYAAKAAIEAEALAARDVEVVVLCPTAIFGELDVKAGTGFLVVALGHGALPFHVDGLTNVVDADALAAAHLLAAERGQPGHRYIVGGHNLGVRELIDALSSTLGVRVTSRRLPCSVAGALATLAEVRAERRANGKRPLLSREMVDVVRFGRWVDTRKATHELGVPAPVPLESTLAKACNWFRRYGYLPQK